ncbi:MAG: hypothetical protein COA78_38575 [Blastopirellula sp.]|nr:MAG: hypothetical protein COA78_38575 [Blastopirellula sp.]
MVRLVAIFALIFSVISGSYAGELSFSAALGTIQVDQVKQHVDILADDSFEGREAGSRGGRAAGNYLVGLMKEYGLEPAGDRNTYFQAFHQQRFRNIIGILPGSDPELKDEVIMIGAHYDHVGYGNKTNSYGPFGYVHNGADDNASGTSGLLEIIQAFTSMEQAPRRTIAFAFWDGEEKGLLGSKHWVSQPTLKLDHIKFYMNIDMIGRLRNEQVEVFGTRTSYGLRQAISYANESENLVLDISWKMKSDSDHHTFYQKNIPVMMLHTGLHKDYHRPQDDAHLINNEGIQSLAKVMFRFNWVLANQDESLAFRKQARFDNPTTKKRFETTNQTRKSRIGISWNAKEEEKPGVVITRVAYQSPADKAGIRTGDRLMEFAGIPVGDVEQFLINVQASAKQTSVAVERQGEEEILILPITLAEKPTPIGFSWQVDTADPSMVMLTNVVSGSLASVSGLKPIDRVYSVNGKNFSTSQEFYDLVTQFGDSLELKIERNGRIHSVELETSRLKEILSANDDTEIETSLNKINEVQDFNLVEV